MRDVAAAESRGHGEVDAERLQREVRLGQVGGHGVRLRPGPRVAEAVDVDIDEGTQPRRQLGDVDPRSAVDVGGELAREQSDEHVPSLGVQR